MIFSNKKLVEVISDDSFFKWCCERLYKEHGVYSLDSLLPSDSWKNIFIELFPLRLLWRKLKQQKDSTSQRKYKINVFARFRPKHLSNIERLDNEEENEMAQVNLPLHQRLALIKMSNNIDNNREALGLLMKEGEWFQKRWREEGNEDIISNENIKLNRIGMTSSIQTIDQETGKVVMIAPDVGLREFTFDSVFPPELSQKTFYDSVARKLVVDFLNGFNATAIVYGQTGSGKTYSMFGQDGESLHSKEISSHGVVPRVCTEIISALENRLRINNIHSKLSVSYVEVFGDEIFDLLREGARCGHSRVAAQRYVLSGAAERLVTNFDDVQEILRIGELQKRFAATAMNERSSRAHTVFILSLEQSKNISSKDKKKVITITRKSKFFLADLGGSEQVKKSLMDQRSGNLLSTGFTTGDRMREAININLGLFALKRCVEAINTNAKFIPYQESKLTMLLSTGLGGNSKTSIVICASIDPKHAVETLGTLRFGEKCAMIETVAHSQASMLEGLLADIDARISSLEAKIRAKEHWEKREELRMDIRAENGSVEAGQGKLEVKNIFVLTGAEEEHKELVNLLNKRSSLTSTTSKNTMKEIQNEKSNRTVGFGREYAVIYDIGEKFNQDSELNETNERFDKYVNAEKLPSVIRDRRKGAQWATGEDLVTDQSILETRAKTVKRNKLMYAGLS